MHLAISNKAFNAAASLPGLSLPVRVVQGVHDAISHGAYGAVRHGSGAALRAADVVGQLAIRTSGAPKDRGHERGHVIRRALNGAFGDALARAGNPVSVAMGFYSGGSRLPLTPGSLHALSARVCIFIHGLGCDESSWQREDPEWAETTSSRALPPGASMHYGALLASEFKVSPIYLRYNTGLPLAENAHRLASLLEQLQGASPA
jgi:hypothetical protein